MSVVTRFAPSPTGFLHIGGARTALFNWLFARRHAGAYLLRIEDTDRARSTDAAITAIFDGLAWLGLTADAPPVMQFARASRHAEVAHALIERGMAFRDYTPPEELAAARERHDALVKDLRGLVAERDTRKAAGEPDANLADRISAGKEAAAAAAMRLRRSPWRDGGKPPHAHAPFVVRLRAPNEGEILNADLVQGPVRVSADELDDFVLLRADGTPTYMLAVVVDDHDMGITHVIRGDDHLTNAARQIAVFRAMGWREPVYAHIPLIHGADGAKLSKRHGALAVQAYRDMGYLPEALNSYLMRLGWNPGDREIMSLSEAAEIFDLGAVNRAPARLDLDKLGSINAHWIRTSDDARLVSLTLAQLADAPHPAEALAVLMPALKARARTIADLVEACRFLSLRRPLTLDASARKALKPETVAMLGAFASMVQDDEGLARAWSEPALGAALKAFAAREGVGMGQIGPGLRAALTGGLPAPDLSFVLAALGREEALGRIWDQVGAVGAA